MNDSTSPPALMPNVRIGISGLPNLTNNMVQGGLYVLVAETASARFPLFASSRVVHSKDTPLQLWFWQLDILQRRKTKIESYSV
jgi:hypothetical protein